MKKEFHELLPEKNINMLWSTEKTALHTLSFILISNVTLTDYHFKQKNIIAVFIHKHQ